MFVRTDVVGSWKNCCDSIEMLMHVECILSGGCVRPESLSQLTVLPFQATKSSDTGIINSASVVDAPSILRADACT